MSVRAGYGRLMVLARFTAACLVVVVIGLRADPPAASAAASLHWLYSSGSVTGGKRITPRPQLSEPAPSWEAKVSLTSDSPLIPVPASMTVPAGADDASITVLTVPTYADT